MDRVERNIQNFTKFQYEVAVKGDFTDLPKLMAPQMLVHRVANATLMRLNGAQIDNSPKKWNRDDFPKNWEHAMAGRIDHSRKIEEIYGTGDVIFARFILEWTHAETFQGIPPTGRRIRVNEAAIVHYDDEGRMYEGWFMSDPLELFEQLGAKVTVTPS